MPTDTERLDFLQVLTNLGKYTGRVILRDSRSGRGWRLHETIQPKATHSVRDAIDNYMSECEIQEFAAAFQHSEEEPV